MPSEEMHHGAQGSARTEAQQPAAPETQAPEGAEAQLSSPETQQKTLEALVAENEAKDTVIADHETRIARQDAEISDLKAAVAALSGASSLELPTAARGNIRETIKFDNLGTRSTKYNTQGVDPGNPYNAFAPEAEPKGPERTEDQPRRSRKLTNGETEVLVKYNNNGKIEYKWEAPADKPTADEVTDGIAEFERQRDAGMFNDIEPGQKAEDAPAAPAAGAEQSESADAPESAEPTEAGAENAPSDTPEATEGDQATPENAPVEPTEPAEEEPTAEEAAEQEPAKQFEIPQTAELIKAKGRLEDAVEQYAKLTAKERGGYTGHFLHNSELLVKIPGLKKLADKYNAWDDKELNESREAYVAATTALQNEIVKAMQETYGEEADERAIQEANLVAINADMKLEAQIMKDRMDNDPKANKFMNWWLKHDSLGKKILKYGLPGAAIGAVTALAGAPILLGAGVAAAGAGVMAHITNRHRANSVNAESGAVYAKENYDQDLARKSAYADEQEKTGSIISAANFSEITEERTGREKTKNRTNVASSAAIAFGGAKLAGLGVDMLTPDANADAGAGSGAEDEAARKAAEEEAARRAAEEAAKTPEIVGNEFTVEGGSGYTQELMDFAGANGHTLTPDQSWQLHQDLMGQFGSDYIDINGAGADTYVDAGDVRLTEPGSAKWADGVGQYIQQWMATRGLW